MSTTKDMLRHLLCLVLFYYAFADEEFNFSCEDGSPVTGLFAWGDVFFKAKDIEMLCMGRDVCSKQVTSYAFTETDEYHVIHAPCPDENQIIKSMNLSTLDDRASAISITCCTLKDGIMMGEKEEYSSGELNNGAAICPGEDGSIALQSIAVLTTNPDKYTERIVLQCVQLSQ